MYIYDYFLLCIIYTIKRLYIYVCVSCDLAAVTLTFHSGINEQHYPSI